MKRGIVLTSACSLVACGVLRADTISPTYSETDGTQTAGPTVTNLLTQGQPTLGGLSQSDFTPWGGGSSDINALNNNELNAFSLSLPNASWTLTATLNTSANTFGYNITEIKTISGWNADYVDQNYQLSYSTAAAPTVFIPLGTYALNNVFSTEPGNHQVTLAIDLAGTFGGVIAGNAAVLKFDFSAANGDSHWHNATAYREIEVFGTPAVAPEPSSLMLCGIGLVAAGRRRRRTT